MAYKIKSSHKYYLVAILIFIGFLFFNNTLSVHFKNYYLSYQFVSVASGKRYFEYPVSAISLLRYQYKNSRSVFKKQLRQVFSTYAEPEYIDKWHQKIIVGKTGNQELDRHIGSVVTKLSNRAKINIIQSDIESDWNILVHFYDGKDREYRFEAGQKEMFIEGWKYKLNWPETIYVDRKLGSNGTTIEMVANEVFALYRDAVPFTYKHLGQVEGYYRVLPDSKGEIVKAECYIFDKHEINIKKSLITECIIRSLGFSGFTNGDSILSRRNSWGENYVYLTELDYSFLTVLYNNNPPYFKRDNLLSIVESILTQN